MSRDQVGEARGLRADGSVRNPRGEGGKLRSELLDAARSIIASTGTEEAVTLRAVAREVGVTAPSIYRHFASREEIIDALVAETFASFVQRLESARDSESTPLGRLRALCDSYFDFADEQIAAYLVLFERRRSAEHTAEIVDRSRPFDGLAGQQAFGILVGAIEECADEGILQTADATADGMLLWSCLHGFVTLRTSSPGFPWPEGTAATRDAILGRFLGVGLHREDSVR